MAFNLFTVDERYDGGTIELLAGSVDVWDHRSRAIPSENHS